ncbi:hypothetical protein [Cellulomonas endometrii]|uniref:hypothetical protein n=1 Tax=Cellulomonas endometrii TaxID=3036301 RepID=UPI0024AC8AF4|nr:hypothetical protein [Cellulomonas endometrii]
MTDIHRGSRVLARTAQDAWVPLRATTGVTDGVDFPIVWLLEEERWIDVSTDDGGAPADALPWPATDVRLATEEEGASA